MSKDKVKQKKKMLGEQIIDSDVKLQMQMAILEKLDDILEQLKENK